MRGLDALGVIAFLCSGVALLFLYERAAQAEEDAHPWVPVDGEDSQTLSL